MTTYLGNSCSFGLLRVPFVNCRQFMYLVISLLVLRAGCGIWLYQFLIIAYHFTLPMCNELDAISWWCVGWNRISFSGETRFALSNGGSKTHKKSVAGIVMCWKGIDFLGHFRGLGWKKELTEDVLCCHARQFQCIITTTSCDLKSYHFSIIFTNKKLKWY